MFLQARGFNVLAQAWAQIEKQRLARLLLIEPAGLDARPLPLPVVAMTTTAPLTFAAIDVGTANRARGRYLRDLRDRRM